MAGRCEHEVADDVCVWCVNILSTQEHVHHVLRESLPDVSSQHTRTRTTRTYDRVVEVVPNTIGTNSIMNLYVGGGASGDKYLTIDGKFDVGYTQL